MTTLGRALATSSLGDPPAEPSPHLAPDAVVSYHQGPATLTVRRAYCKGCRLCVEACPAHILALDEEDLVYVTDVGRCLFCGACSGRCPDFVFVLDKGEGRT
jgi:2-oxoglutarate ferredoxin oxidoreductase subunit delta